MFIIPLPKDFASKSKPWTTLGLIVFNTLLLVVTWISFIKIPSADFYREFGFVPAHPHLGSLFFSMFIHAGIFHLVGNMVFLFFFAIDVEDAFGHWMFGLIYLLSGLGGHALHWFFHQTSAIPCVGASGAISGVAGAYFVLFPKSRFDLMIFLWRFHIKTIPAHTHVAVGAWIVEQTVLGLITQAIHVSAIAFWAHVGGFAVGVVCALVFKLATPEMIDLKLQELPVHARSSKRNKRSRRAGAGG